ncbi:MAG: cation transporter [Bacillota bacterium]|nr:cation transporter [Bacillota bacterium]
MSDCNCGQNKSLKQLTVVVTGMSCGHCKKAVEDAVKKLAGVRDASVDLERGLLTVTFDPQKVRLAEIQDAVVGAGYEAQPA